LAAGIDRGIVEGFMGHKFGLDSAYLRLSDDQLRELYAKAADSMSFGDMADSSIRARVEKLEDENRALREQVEKFNEWREEMLREAREEWEKAPRNVRHKFLEEVRKQARTHR
jgi:hypothetical protein